MVLTNLSGESKIAQIESKVRKRNLEEYFTGEMIRSLNDIELSPYLYKVYISKHWCPVKKSRPPIGGRDIITVFEELMNFNRTLMISKFRIIFSVNLIIT